MVEERLVDKFVKKNKSVHFILPMIDVPFAIYRYNILNSYLTDVNRPKLDLYHVFLLAKEGDPKLEKLKSYIENYKVKDGFMYVFRIPSEYEEDYLKFILGQYSQFSGDYKNKIIRLLPAGKINESAAFKVIMKHPDAKKKIEELIGCSIGDQEVASIPDLKKEEYGN